MPDKRIAATAGALLYGLLLAFLPLFRELHFLSASLTATMGAFAAAWVAGGMAFRHKPASGLRELAWLFVLAYLPLIPILGGSLIRGCFSGDGLAFWILIPGPSVALGFAIGRYFRYTTKRPRLYSVLLLLFISIGLLIWELYNHPQVFFHNHVWGYWPGPIYDDVVELSPSVLFFRYITLAWAALLWLLPFFYTRKGVRLPVLLIALSLMLSYLNMSRTGIIHSEDFIRQALGGVYETRHAVIIHDRNISPDEIAWLGMLHDFHIEELSEALGLNPGNLQPVRSYIYQHEWQKKALTGAGNTVYVPVWNRNPQMHIHLDAVLSVLRHELVHVLAREFGMPVLNASPNVALIEGLAVALQGERNPSAGLHQIVASQDELPNAELMASMMSPTGFYRLSGPLSYTLAGSFTAWLLDAYDPALFRRAYATGSIPRAYGKSIEELVAGWHSFLRTVETDPAQLVISDRIFDAPGITELSCVFHPSATWRLMQRSGRMLAEKRDEEAFELLSIHLENADMSRVPVSIIQRWAITGLRLNEADNVLRGLDKYSAALENLPWSVRILKSDAFFLTGDDESASYLLLESEHSDHRSAVVRLDDELRESFINLEYNLHTQEIGDDELPDLLIPYLLRNCIRFDLISGCKVMEPSLTDLADARYYQIYESFVVQLLRNGAYDHSLSWIDALDSQLEQSPINYAKHNRLNQLKRISDFVILY
ncbi:MAG: hypothetical protein LAT84_02655 [Balneolia bacterium]|nr:hypothetical protein [Balneolia bacterium]